MNDELPEDPLERDFLQMRTALGEATMVLARVEVILGAIREDQKKTKVGSMLTEALAALRTVQHRQDALDGRCAALATKAELEGAVQQAAANAAERGTQAGFARLEAAVGVLQMTAAQHWPRLLTVALSFALIMGFSGFFIGRWAAYHAADVEAAETVTQLTHIPAETLQAYVTWLRSGNNPRWLQCEGGEQGTNNGRSVCTRTFWLSPR